MTRPRETFILEGLLGAPSRVSSHKSQSFLQSGDIVFVPESFFQARGCSRLLAYSRRARASLAPALLHPPE
ncbi:hypothetical protein MYSTI_02202 [Myxococcus stipitatus DSM 14675]|uniref:Uncharacterized protein n=1 Tax=Myxococcus stipitatus (strain DSM 14675 / JCM 12634 / Mx s8) TaxID=1278073 RepID=L7UAQ3_MYXSD|nr:hypothetical protein [Myxococcus stipitatus]AGC43529.1 hypothetical protein MYSTI_02202 [Myxococcus stipitatus DSM 14675]